MVRVRLIVLAMLAALLAPSVAPCMPVASAPGHAQMPCCKTVAGGGASARPCCAPPDQAPLAPAQTVTPMAPPAVVASRVAIPVCVAVARLHSAAAPLAAVQLQLRSTVLLI